MFRFTKVSILFGLSVGLFGCDIEGEVRQGDISSTIAANSGAAGGNSPVLGGVYYDSLEGLSISNTGLPGQSLILNNNLQPEWVNTIGGALAITGGEMLGNIGLNGSFLSGDLDNEGIFVDSLGNVGINTSSPIHELHVEGNAIKTVGGTAWATISDRNLKTNIRPAVKGLESINQLKLKQFSYINNKQLGLVEREEVGLIAQDVLPIFPESVMYSGQYMMLDFHPIYMAQIKAIQELSAENKALEKRLQELEKKLDRLLK